MADVAPTGLEELTEFDLAWPHHADTLRPTGQSGVLIPLEDRGTGEYRRVEGYKLSACLLAERLQEGGHGDESLLYPFALCWRHHLELQMKMLISDSAAAYGEREPNDLSRTHSLGALWGWAKPYILRTFPDDDSANTTVPDRIIGQLVDIDPDGAAFRYAKRVNGTSTVPRPISIDIGPFHQALLGLSSYFNGAIEGTSWLADQQPDWSGEAP